MVTSTCSNGQTLTYQSSNSTWICTTQSSGVTSVNSFTGTVNIHGTQGDISVTNSSGTITLDTGSNILHLIASGQLSGNSNGFNMTSLGTGHKIYKLYIFAKPQDSSHFPTLRFNNDAGGNYYYQQYHNYGGGIGFVSGGTHTKIDETANTDIKDCEITIWNDQVLTNDHEFSSTCLDVSTGFDMYQTFGSYATSAEITSIDVIAVDASSNLGGGFVAGSQWYLYTAS